MNGNFSDENLDLILGKLVKDTLLSEETIDEIAASPHLWRQVRKCIDAEKEKREKNRFIFWNWRIAAFASLFLAACTGLFWLNLSDRDNLLAERISAEKTPFELADTAAKPKTEETESAGFKAVSIRTLPKRISAKRELKAANLPKLKNAKLLLKQSAPPPLPTKQSAPETEEVKTDFIALSYLPTPESGQILKVKVPRSMMSALGVEKNVENSSELVNAEIIVGDDGLTRAIRFVE